MSFNARKSAEFIDRAHASRARYANLPPEFGPATLNDAYAAQEALVDLWIPCHGPIAGRKIATTTRIMQQLMGIDHPCGGVIFANRVHNAPAVIRRATYVNLVVECELAVRLACDMPKQATPYTRDQARAAVASVMAAFELIEDRNAVYKETRALSLIADNAWNGGIVIGDEVLAPGGSNLDGVDGVLEINGQTHKSGKTDDPMGALAWLAELAASRGQPMTAGMVVITGSVIPTLPIGPDQHFRFTLAGIGSTEMSAA